MNSRHQRPGTANRAPVAPMYRGPQAVPQTAHHSSVPFVHAPNAALLIDFDNVTMGIRSDLGNELRNLLGSDIIKGKVQLQRAYADWRRYPQYVVPLAESSIDMIMAPAYGSSKKNATDIRLAVDAMELVFTRPEIGTFILLSGDSDFSTLVIKLKEYGKYVIGVGIRESSSDLLVQNCDEYYSYNALAGLVKTAEEEQVKRDPWELVGDAIKRMKRNGDVMRSDRLKQVMQEIDSTFDESNLGMAKFSRFVQEAAQRGLLRANKLENGQMEVDLADGATVAPTDHAAARREPRPEAPREDRPPTREGATAGVSGGGRDRGRRGRGRDRGRERPPRPAEARADAPAAPDGFSPPLDAPVTAPLSQAAPRAEALPAPARPAVAGEPEMTGERLTRTEALDLLRQSVARLGLGPEDVARASDIRRTAREILGRDSETLSERYFARILRDAHDANVIDLRRRGDDFEVAPAANAEPIAAQLAAAEPVAAAQGQAGRSAANANAIRRGLRGRGGGGRGGPRPARPEAPPPELFAIGIIDEPAPAPTSAQVALDLAGAPAESITPEARAASPARRRSSTKTAAKKATARRSGRGASASAAGESADAEAKPKRRRTAARKKGAAGGDG
ncbi:MAG: NYN domain-containing protein [Gemmatimonadaceae bacterium]